MPSRTAHANDRYAPSDVLAKESRATLREAERDRAYELQGGYWPPCVVEPVDGRRSDQAARGVRIATDVGLLKPVRPSMLWPGNRLDGFDADAVAEMSAPDLTQRACQRSGDRRGLRPCWRSCCFWWGCLCEVDPAAMELEAAPPVLVRFRCC